MNPSHQINLRLALPSWHRVRVWANRTTRGNKTAMLQLLIDRGLDAWDTEQVERHPNIKLPKADYPPVPALTNENADSHILENGMVSEGLK